MVISVRTLSLVLSAALLVGLLAPEPAAAQDKDTRDAIWDAIAIPDVPFRRVVNDDDTVVLRVPADWTAVPGKFSFVGANDTSVTAVVDRISSGIPLAAVTASFLTRIRDLPGAEETIVVRRTELDGLEAREISFAFTTARAEPLRRSVWFTVLGTAQVTLVFTCRATSPASDDAIFKAIVQSAIVDEYGIRLRRFQEARADAGLESSPAAIAQTLAIKPMLSDARASERATARARLLAVFADEIDCAADLLVARDPLVRLAAVDAVASGTGPWVEALMRYAIDDDNPVVANRAAAAYARRADAVSNVLTLWNMHRAVDRVERLASCLSPAERATLAAGLLKMEDEPRPSGGFVATIAPQRQAPPGPPPTLPRPPPPARAIKPPPPPPDVSPDGPGGIPGGVPGGVPGRVPGGVPGGIPGGIPGGVPGAFPGDWGSDADDRAALALDLLRTIDSKTAPMPFNQILERNVDVLTALALEVALERSEQIPVRALATLARTKTGRVRSLAVRAIGEWGTRADLNNAVGTAALGTRTSGNEESTIAAAKIAFRTRLASVAPDGRDAVIRGGLADKAIARWVWSRFVRTPDALGDVPPESTVGALGERALPSSVALYAAMRAPNASLARISDVLDGLHAETARDQATLALILQYMRDALSNATRARAGERLLDALGIDGDQPAAAAAWHDEGPPDGEGRRSAVVLRVRDRERFENTLASYIRSTGEFDSFAFGAAGAAHMIGLLPSAIPAVTALAISDLRKQTHGADRLVTVLATPRTYRGVSVTEFVRRTERAGGRIARDRVLVAYIGATAILTPDEESLDAVFDRLTSREPALADSPLFARASATRADIVYFADGPALLRAERAPDAIAAASASESGGVTFERESWRHTYDVPVTDPSWFAAMRVIRPADLAAPRDLLPASTVAYAIASIDTSAGVASSLAPVVGETAAKALRAAWAGDLDRDLAQELGPECGAALLGLPRTLEMTGATWIVFFKSRAGALEERARAGKLFTGVAADAAPRVRLGDTSMVASLQGGFLVIASSAEALERLHSTKTLASTDEYARVVSGAPDANLVVIGGYGSAAALESVGATADDLTVKTVVQVLGAITHAFRGESFYATRTPDGLTATLAAPVDRTGSFTVGDLTSRASVSSRSFAAIEARGVPIADQGHVQSMTVRISAKSGADLDQIAKSLASSGQSITSRDAGGLVIRVEPRRPEGGPSLVLPVTDATFAPYLGATHEIRSTDPAIVAQAKEIAGDDRDAVSIAGKLADWTFNNLRWKRVDIADAADTLASREADCLEFSELYVSMARALGMPARIVSGLVHSDGSFGGHAWVEVYTGRWVEIDPTFGTRFVDATHIRDDSYSIVAYAALGLVDIEVLSAPLPVAEYQHDARALVAQLVREKPNERLALSAAIDVRELADRTLGEGAWSSMTPAERSQFTAARRRLVRRVGELLGDEEEPGETRLLALTVNGGEATALIRSLSGYDEQFARLRFGRAGDVWVLAGAEDLDNGIDIVREAGTTAAECVRAERDARQPRSRVSLVTAALEVLDDDPKTALDLIDRAGEDGARDPRLETLRGVCLVRQKKLAEAEKLLGQTTTEFPDCAVAYRELARVLAREKADAARRIAALRRYVALEPADPSGYEDLAWTLLESGDKPGATDALTRASLADPTDVDRAAAAVASVAVHASAADALKALDGAAGRGIDRTQLVGGVFRELANADGGAAQADALAAARPELLKGNERAIYYLAEIRFTAERPRDALELYRECTRLTPDDTDAWLGLSDAYRMLHEWREALAAADHAIAVDDAYGYGHYLRACALSRLGRADEAMAALTKAAELDDDTLDQAMADDDLAALRERADFRKLVDEASHGGEIPAGDAPVESIKPPR